jgi:hypothetical protein
MRTGMAAGSTSTLTNPAAFLRLLRRLAIEQALTQSALRLQPAM